MKTLLRAQFIIPSKEYLYNAQDPISIIDRHVFLSMYLLSYQNGVHPQTLDDMKRSSSYSSPFSAGFGTDLLVFYKEQPAPRTEHAPPRASFKDQPQPGAVVLGTTAARTCSALFVSTKYESASTEQAITGRWRLAILFVSPLRRLPVRMT